MAKRERGKLRGGCAARVVLPPFRGPAGPPGYFMRRPTIAACLARRAV